MEQNQQPQQSQENQQSTNLASLDTKNKINPVLIFGVAMVIFIGIGTYVFVNKSDKSLLPSPSSPSTQTINQEPILDIQDNFIPDVKNEAFIATTENGVLDITILNPIENKIIVSKKIALDAFLASSSTNAYGSNDSVQYNPKTKEIFFATEGHAPYDGSCANKDGTCTSRLYKIGLDQTEPTILFESDNSPMNWVLNSLDNSLLLSLYVPNTQTIKKISVQDGKVIFTKEYQIKEYINLTDFVLSKDGKYTYQATGQLIDGKWADEILRLRKIDNSNGDITEQEIFRGDAIDFETNISPDDNYLAFYSGVQPSEKLYIYEISTKKLTNIPYQGSIGNYNLLWSGDSKKLLYILKNSLVYYDTVLAKSVLITEDSEQTFYVYAWGPAINYFMYQSQDNGVKIFDIQKNQIIDTQIKSNIEVKGINWY